MHMNTVTVEDAFQIARKDLIEEARSTNFDIVDGDDWPAYRLLPCVCIEDDHFPNGCWLLYFPPNVVDLDSTFLFVIDKSSGNILYRGPAYDEGSLE